MKSDGGYVGSPVQKLFMALSSLEFFLLGGCAELSHRSAPRGLDSYRRQSERTVCRRIASSSPDDTSVLLTFRRLHGGSRDTAISVYLAWQRDPDPIYTPRGPVRAIRISEAGHVVEVPMAAIRSEPGRTLEDLWPEYVQLASPSPGEYELLLPSDVPAGVNATLVVIHQDSFRTATTLESESYRSGSSSASR